MALEHKNESYLVQYTFYARPSPGLSSVGRVGVQQTPYLFAPADDRNTLATSTVGCFNVRSARSSSPSSRKLTSPSSRKLTSVNRSAAN